MTISLIEKLKSQKGAKSGLDELKGGGLSLLQKIRVQRDVKSNLTKLGAKTSKHHEEEAEPVSIDEQTLADPDSEAAKKAKKAQQRWNREREKLLKTSSPEREFRNFSDAQAYLKKWKVEGEFTIRPGSVHDITGKLTEGFKLHKFERDAKPFGVFVYYATDIFGEYGDHYYITAKHRVPTLAEAARTFTNEFKLLQNPPRWARPQITAKNLDEGIWIASPLLGRLLHTANAFVEGGEYDQSILDEDVARDVPQEQDEDPVSEPEKTEDESKADLLADFQSGKYDNVPRREFVAVMRKLEQQGVTDINVFREGAKRWIDVHEMELTTA